MTYINFNSSSSKVTATKGKLGCTGSIKLLDLSGLSLNSATIDKILVACATHINWAAKGILRLTGNNAPPTTAASTSITKLRNNGCTVEHK